MQPAQLSLSMLQPHVHNRAISFTLLSLLEPTQDQPHAFTLCKNLATAARQRLDPSFPLLAAPVCTLDTWEFPLHDWQQTASTLIILPWGCSDEKGYSGFALLDKLTRLLQPGSAQGILVDTPELIDWLSLSIESADLLLEYLALCPGWTTTCIHATVGGREILITRAPDYTPLARQPLASHHFHALSQQLIHQETDQAETSSAEALTFLDFLSSFLNALLGRAINMLPLE